jgi:hypothetical protein
MTLIGEILFAILVLINLVTIPSLGLPWTYRDRGVSWYLWGTAWSAVSFDGVFLFAILAKANGRLIEAAFLLALGLRVIVAAWLLRLIVKSRRLGDWDDGTG